MYFYINKSTETHELIHVSFYIQKGVLGMVKVWKDVNEVINESIDVDEKYKGIKKVMEEAPNGVDVKPMSKFRKDTRIEKY